MLNNIEGIKFSCIKREFFGDFLRMSITTLSKYITEGNKTNKPTNMYSKKKKKK